MPIFILRFLQDPVANTIAVIVFLGMITSVFYTAYIFLNPTSKFKPYLPSWIFPILCVIGIGIAGYLSYIELSHSQAICGPVGDCNAVQRSPYARLWGIFPIGVIGMVGYLVIIAVWLCYRFGPQRQQNVFAQILWGVVLLGVLFSAYLTFLEPFVIGATCAWCIATAIVITLLLWLTTLNIILED